MMRVIVVLALMIEGCSCTEKKESPAPLAPAVVPALERPTPPPGSVTATWQQVSLSPQRAEVVAKIDYGPSASPITVQLELPNGARVTHGRTFFELQPASERKTHVEPLSIASDALPVGDLVMVVTGPSLTLREAYGFGRPRR